MSFRWPNRVTCSFSIATAKTPNLERYKMIERNVLWSNAENMNYLDPVVFTMHNRFLVSLCLAQIFELSSSAPRQLGTPFGSHGYTTKSTWPSTAVLIPISHEYTVLTFLLYDSRKFWHLTLWKNTILIVLICAFVINIFRNHFFSSPYNSLFLIVTWYMVIYATRFLLMYI